MTAYSWLWLVWAAFFAVVEGVALANKKPGDTLSEHVWAVFGTKRNADGSPAPKRSGWTQLRRFVLLAGMAWLAVHFLTGGWV